MDWFKLGAPGARAMGTSARIVTAVAPQNSPSTFFVQRKDFTVSQVGAQVD
jgi:hypothetical protein